MPNRSIRNITPNLARNDRGRWSCGFFMSNIRKTTPPIIVLTSPIAKDMNQGFVRIAGMVYARLLHKQAGCFFTTFMFHESRRMSTEQIHA